MKSPSVEMMWEAVKNNDSTYDGAFYYGVKTTGIFCRPSCKSKVPNRENVVYFDDVHEAVKAGFRPCKRCRPDMLEQQTEPMEEICIEVSRILENEFSKPDVLEKLAERVRVSQYHLQRVYKRGTGFTPKARLQRIRVGKAMEHLEGSSLNNTEICYAVGFQSLSRFYDAFREVTGVSPRKYRLNCLSEKQGGESDGNCI